MHCTQCGISIPEGAAFCGSCGAPAPHNAAEAAQATPTAGPTVRAPGRRLRRGWLILPVLLIAAAGGGYLWQTKGESAWDPVVNSAQHADAGRDKNAGASQATTNAAAPSETAGRPTIPAEPATLAAWANDLRRAIGFIGSSKRKLVHTLGEPNHVDNMRPFGGATGAYTYRAGPYPLSFYFDDDKVAAVEIEWSNIQVSIPEAGHPERADDVWYAVDPASAGPTRLVGGDLGSQQWWQYYRGDPRQQPFPDERGFKHALLGSTAQGYKVILECVGFEPSILTPYTFDVNSDRRVQGKSVPNPRFDWRTALVTKVTVGQDITRYKWPAYRGASINDYSRQSPDVEALEAVFPIDPRYRPGGNQPQFVEDESFAPSAIVPDGPNRENTEPIHRDDKVEVTARFIGPNDTYKAEVFRTADPFPIATISSFTGSEVRLHFPGVVTHARYFFRITKLSSGETRQPKGFYLKSGGPRHQFKGTTITW